MIKILTFCFLFIITINATAQQTEPIDTLKQIDTLKHVPEVYADSSLRIINLNPYFTLHVDSTLNYDIDINRTTDNYFWYLRNSPVGVKIDRNSGNLIFKADKSYFKSGKLRYDQDYKVQIGVQNLQNPTERVDTSFIIVFYSTEINASKVKPSVTGTLSVEEGDSIRFKVQCENGSFPVEQITLTTNIPISNYKPIRNCDDEFSWMVPFDFIRDDDTAKQRALNIQFISADKFFNKDTAVVKIVVRPGINYPIQNLEHKRVYDELQKYVLSLKLTFYVISKSVKSNKSTRTGFDITGSTTALAGTVISTSASTDATKNIGKILPSVGLTLVPVKEAVAPNKIQEQNTATQVRSVAKRLEYLASENTLLGERDPNVQAKIKRMQDEMKQARLQLVDLPLVEFDERFTPEDAEKYFRDPKVNKKYKLKVN
ncbi:hypothetical protein BH10BAC3_BH10BAC3_24100 [soil metagenome]